MIVEKIKEAFGIKENTSCEIQILEKTFSIRDDKENEPAYITDFEEGHFTIVNTENRKLAFLPIDICVFGSGDGKKCDFGVSDNLYLVLVDIKDYSKSQRSKGRKVAIKQMMQTINNIKQKIDTSVFTTFAVIGFTFENDNPAAKTRRQDAEAEFEELNAILLEGNSFEFSTDFIHQYI